MGLFEDAGKRFEQFKQAAEGAAQAEAEYECEACGARFYAQRDQCQECGADEVVPIEPTERSDEQSAERSDEQSAPPADEDPESRADDEPQ